MIPQDLEQIFSRLPHPATDIREIQARSVLAHGGYTDESRHLHPRKRYPSIQTRIAPSDYPANVTFCLRYTLGGKRRWEQLSVGTYKEAQAAALKRLSNLITEECGETSIGAKISKNLALPAPRPRPEATPIAKTGELMLDAAMDKYLENVATKSSKTSRGYRYTLRQFYSSTGNSLLSSVTTQQLYDFVGYLRREGLGDRTIHNRVGEVVTFLRHFGIKDVTIRVKFVEQSIATSNRDQPKSLMPDIALPDVSG